MKARALLTVVGVSLGLPLMMSSPVAADEAARVEVVGDSLLRMTDLSHTPWVVRARDGRTLQGAQRLLSLVAGSEPDVLIVALGTNDVAYNHSPQIMARDLRRAARATADVPCVIYTTVTTFGTAFYNRNWLRAAQSFNRALWLSGVPVANWAGEVRRHPEHLLADGVHPSSTGAIAYGELLGAAVDRHCPPAI